jgi:hypothetical protein
LRTVREVVEVGGGARPEEVGRIDILLHLVFGLRN